MNFEPKKIDKTTNDFSQILNSDYSIEELLAPDVLAYCGYKFENNKIIPSGFYNPIPYQGLEGVNVQYRK